MDMTITVEHNGEIISDTLIIDIPEDLLTSGDTKQDIWTDRVKNAAGRALAKASRLVAEKAPTTEV